MSAPMWGCGSGTPKAEQGGGLTVVVATPLQGPNADQGKDLVRAARLQLESVDSTVAGRKVRIRQLNESGAVQGAADPEHVAKLVEAASADPSVVAWIGGLDSDSLAVELPRLNEAGLAAVSPGATATPFNRRDPAFPGAPVKYYPSIAQFGMSLWRITTNDLSIAAKALTDLRAKGVRSVFTVDIGDTDGDSFSSAVEQMASSHGIALVGHESVVGQNADWAGIALEAKALRAKAIIWSSPAGVDQLELWRAVAKAKGRELMVSGPAVPPSGISKLPKVLGQVLSFGPIVPPDLQGPSGGVLESRFNRAYGHGPAAGSLRAVPAMAVVLDALRRAVELNRGQPDIQLRAAVIAGLAKTRNVPSLLGGIRLSPLGDWNSAPVGVWSLEKGVMKFGRVLP